MFKTCIKPVFSSIMYQGFNYESITDNEEWYNYNSYYAMFETYQDILFCSILKLGDTTEYILPQCLDILNKKFTDNKLIGFHYHKDNRSSILVKRLIKNYKVIARLVEGEYICVVIERN